MRLVRDLMTRTVTTLHAGDPVARATRDAQLANIGHFPIVDRQGLLVGVVSNHDLARATDPARPLREIMTSQVVTVDEETELTEAAYLIYRHRIGCLPVCDRDGKLAGILTETDFVRLAYALLGGPDLEDRAREERESERL